VQVNNDPLMAADRNQEKPIVGRCDPPNAYHPAAGGTFDTAHRAQAAAPIPFAHKALEEGQDRHLNHSNVSAVGVDPMPVSADPDTSSRVRSPGSDNDRRGQLELDLHLADARPHIDSIANGLEIEAERRLSDQLA
jgi:hypothetical protein